MEGGRGDGAREGGKRRGRERGRAGRRDGGTEGRREEEGRAFCLLHVRPNCRSSRDAYLSLTYSSSPS